jgi:hypothetical protein
MSSGAAYRDWYRRSRTVFLARKAKQDQRVGKKPVQPARPWRSTISVRLDEPKGAGDGP